MKLGILKSYPEVDSLVESYKESCRLCGVDYVVLDLLADDWIEQVKDSHVDGVLVREKANISEYKEMYNERLWVINKYLDIPIYPSWQELFLYENKRMYSYFFETHGIKTPETHVFYTKRSAMDYCRKTPLPFVFKTNGGAGGSGVTIVKNKMKAYRMIRSIFGRMNPRLALGHIPSAKVGGFLPIPKFGMSQRHYVIIQEYIDIETEWRIIKIGETYAGYMRPLEHGHGSCNLMEYGMPPEELLYLLKDISERERFDSLSLDVLVSKDHQFYVTEMQSLFGSFNPYQCMINGKPGRIMYKNGRFVFEEGEVFFQHNSNVLRVKDFVNKLESGYYKNHI